MADLAAWPDILSARHWQAVKGGGRINNIEAGMRDGRDTVIERVLVVVLAHEAVAREWPSTWARSSARSDPTAFSAPSIMNRSQYGGVTCPHD
jgi:hypothetical protein